jgi:hypothetical protein
MNAVDKVINFYGTLLVGKTLSLESGQVYVRFDYPFDFSFSEPEIDELCQRLGDKFFGTKVELVKSKKIEEVKFKINVPDKSVKETEDQFILDVIENMKASLRESTVVRYSRFSTLLMSHGDVYFSMHKMCEKVGRERQEELVGELLETRASIMGENPPVFFIRENEKFFKLMIYLKNMPDLPVSSRVAIQYSDHAGTMSAAKMRELAKLLLSEKIQLEVIE